MRRPGGDGLADGAARRRDENCARIDIAVAECVRWGKVLETARFSWAGLA